MQFKLYGTVAIAFCICFVQICHSADVQTMKDYKEFYGIQDLNTYVNGSNAIQEIGSEFAEDVQLILEKFYNNTYVTHIITVDLVDLIADDFHGNVSKITSATVKEVNSEMEDIACWKVNVRDILIKFLLQQLPSERIYGVINLYSVLHNMGTQDDVENALGYLYGTKTRPMTFSPDIPSMSSVNCSGFQNWRFVSTFQDLINYIASLGSTKLNPKILTDLRKIVNQFPYDLLVYQLLEYTKALLIELNGKNSVIEICDLKNQYPWFKSDSIFYMKSVDFDTFVWGIKLNVIDLETILPLRVPEENFVNLLNLVRASYRIQGGVWRKAVEYAYNPDYFNLKWCSQKNVTATATLNA